MILVLQTVLPLVATITFLIFSLLLEQSSPYFHLSKSYLLSFFFCLFSFFNYESEITDLQDTWKHRTELHIVPLYITIVLLSR